MIEDEHGHGPFRGRGKVMQGAVIPISRARKWAGIDFQVIWHRLELHKEENGYPWP